MLLTSTSTDPAAALLAALQRAQDRYALFPSPPPGRRHLVLVAVSGGGDSVALLHLLHHLAPTWRLALHVGHVDHGLRPDSAQDAAFVARLAQDLDLPFHLRRLDPQALRQAGNLEAAAREARYQALVDMLHTALAQADDTVDRATGYVAVAHTADDQAETLLMRLVRGTGLPGLAGMRPVRSMEERPLDLGPSAHLTPRLVRPLLSVNRAELRTYLREAGIPWREDPTNRDLDRVRNRVRHQILPRLQAINPQVIPALARTGLLLADEADRLAQLDRAAFRRLCVHQDPDRVVLDRAAFLAEDRATQRGVLRLAWQVLDAPPEALDFEAVEDLRVALAQIRGATGPHPVGAGVSWTASREHFAVHRSGTTAFPLRQPHLPPGTQRPVPVPGCLDVDGWRLTATTLRPTELPADWRERGPWEAFLDADRLVRPVLTTPQPGMRVQPLGMSGSRSVGDLFTDCGVPPEQRPGWPILVDEATGQVAWVCGLRIGHPFRITPETRRVVHLRWEARP